MTRQPRRLLKDLAIVAVLILIFWTALHLMNPDASPFTRMLSVMEVR